jgi:hypothetical protein
VDEASTIGVDDASFVGVDESFVGVHEATYKMSTKQALLELKMQTQLVSATTKQVLLLLMMKQTLLMSIMQALLDASFAGIDDEIFFGRWQGLLQSTMLSSLGVDELVSML